MLTPVSDPAAESSTSALPESGRICPEEENSAWRDELSARLNRYRARRKAPPPRYPSLKLPFSPLESLRPSAPESSTFGSLSNHALALEPQPELLHMETSPPEPVAEVQAPARHHVPHGGAKIIEFPRLAWGPPPPPSDQLAEPVTDTLRILEVPEVAPPPPALGGITIEPAQPREIEKRPGIDIPLQSAPLGLRLVAFLIDSVIVGAASALFAFIFWKVAAFRPPQIQIMSLVAGISCLFWGTYQYLLIVYSGSTPGLRATHLELTRFDGSSTTRSLRRWRVLGSYLSAASLGMGYAWVFLDEDALCWHDRITHSYMAPQRPANK